LAISEAIGRSALGSETNRLRIDAEAAPIPVIAPVHVFSNSAIVPNSTLVQNLCLAIRVKHM
jgi:hypothetical protein